LTILLPLSAPFSFFFPYPSPSLMVEYAGSRRIIFLPPPFFFSFFRGEGDPLCQSFFFPSCPIFFSTLIFSQFPLFFSPEDPPSLFPPPPSFLPFQGQKGAGVADFLAPSSLPFPLQKGRELSARRLNFSPPPPPVFETNGRDDFFPPFFFFFSPTCQRWGKRIFCCDSAIYSADGR